MDSEDDVNEFRLDDQLANENNEDMESENVIQKKNLGISDKEYKIFTKEFDEIAKAESLETAEEIQNLTGGEVLAVKADLDSTDDIENLIKEIENKFNTVDILVNNTGGPKAGFFDDLSDEDWLKTFESTFLSAVRVTRKVLPFMKKNKWGRIINISSVSAKQPIDNLMLSNGVRMSIHGWAKTLSNQVASENILIIYWCFTC